MDQNTEKVIIIFSAHKTDQADIRTAEEAVRGYRPTKPRVQVEPLTCRIPAAATPGETLGTELMTHLDESIGAIAFVDDLRPNVVYELGVFHGKGRAVLLVTREPIAGFSEAMSDLAGVPLADLRVDRLDESVTRYLTKLYTDDLRRVDPTPFYSLPSVDANMLSRINHPTIDQGMDAGPYGPMLRVTEYPETDLPVGVNLSPQARARVIMRGTDTSADYFVYFNVRYRDRLGRTRRVWLGVTSTRRDAWITQGERLFPGHTLTRQWRMLPLDFTDMLRRGSLLGASPPDYLETIRFRAGTSDRSHVAPIEIAFIGLSGIDD